MDGGKNRGVYRGWYHVDGVRPVRRILRESLDDALPAWNRTIIHSSINAILRVGKPIADIWKILVKREICALS